MILDVDRYCINFSSYTVKQTKIPDLFLVSTLMSVSSINVHNIQIPFLQNWHYEI